MGYSSALVAGLALLSDALDDPVSDLEAVLSVLGDDLTAAIPSYLGLTCTLNVDDNPVIISTLDPSTTAEVRASLLLPLRDSGTTGSVAFFSGTAGAFIELADDARWIFGPTGAPVLDGYLPTSRGSPAGIRGLSEFQDINQAVGVLIEEGHLPEDAHTELRRRAARRNQTVPEAARVVLDGLGRPDTVA